MVDLAVGLVVSQWMLLVLVEPVVRLELKVVLTEDVGVEPTVEDAGYESRIDWPIVFNSAFCCWSALIWA